MEPLYRGHHWDPAGCPAYIGTQLAVLHTLGPSWLSCIHWDPAGCPVYSGTPLYWTPLGPSWLSCIQWNLSIEDTVGTQLAVLYTLGPSWLSCIQWNLSIEDTIGTQLAVLYRKVSLIKRLMCAQLYVVGTADHVLIREVFSWSVLYREVSLYNHLALIPATHPSLPHIHTPSLLSPQSTLPHT